jgi:RNA polymerase sigma-70 factor (ECF subfamily)
MAEQIPPFLAQAPDPDAALVRAIAAGNARALDDLYARFGPGLLSYLTSLMNNRQVAEEVLQDVMLAVWNNAGSFRGDSKVRTWLLVIARNRAINMRRKYAPPVVSLDDNFDLSSGDTTPLERIERSSQRQLLRQAINSLEASQREILDLVFFHQLSGQEVADILGINVGTVKSRLHRAKENLRRTLLVMGDVSNA